MKQQVHPAFDPKAGKWFIEGLQIETSSLAEMQKQLGSKVTIIDYYPNGVPWELTKSYQVPEGASKISTDRLALGMAGKPNKTFIRAQNAKQQDPYDKDGRRGRILNLWAMPPLGEGLTANQIAERLGIENEAHVEHVIFHARERGDPRAAKRQRIPGLRKSQPAGSTIPWTPERVEFATKRKEQGYTAREIARQLGGVTRSAVIAKLARIENRATKKN